MLAQPIANSRPRLTIVAGGPATVIPAISVLVRPAETTASIPILRSTLAGLLTLLHPLVALLPTALGKSRRASTSDYQQHNRDFPQPEHFRSLVALHTLHDTPVFTIALTATAP